MAISWNLVLLVKEVLNFLWIFEWKSPQFCTDIFELQNDIYTENKFFQIKDENYKFFIQVVYWKPFKSSLIFKRSLIYRKLFHNVILKYIYQI